jgi:hypothetical protein
MCIDNRIPFSSPLRCATPLKCTVMLAVGLHAYNCSTLEAEAGGPQVQDQPGLCNKTLSENIKKKF